MYDFLSQFQLIELNILKEICHPEFYLLGVDFLGKVKDRAEDFFPPHLVDDNFL